MTEENTILYCDKCGTRIVDHRNNTFCHQEITLCATCATELYQKIFEDSEGQRQ